jgi:hypothetical protein
MEKRIQSFLSLFNRKYHYAKTIPDITGKKEVAEVLQNFLFWHGPLAVRAEGKIATTWAKLKW